MKQLILIIALIAGSISLVSYLIKTKPEPRKRVRQPTIPVVEIMTPQLQTYTQRIKASGSVETNRSTNLISEVSGKITSIDPKFQEGNYFLAGQQLLTIDNTNYRNAIIIATAEVAQNELAVKTEQNLANLASREMQLLGNSRNLSEIASRKPQVAAAIANLEAARVKLQQARDDLSKTRIMAPYDGRLLSSSVDVGQYVTPGTQLGQIYSTDYVEVRLPLSLGEYQQLSLPESYSNQQIDSNQLPPVEFSATLGNQTYKWEGRVSRVAAAMDARTRQIPVIARIDNPFRKSSNGAPPVKIGQFLEANIIGDKINNVYIIPTSATRQNREVMMFDEGVIRIRPIEVLASENDKLVISGDSIPPNAKLITTPMPSAKNGMAVRLAGEAPKQSQRRREGGAQGGNGGGQGRPANAGQGGGQGNNGDANARRPAQEAN
ncbi:efflux RND transporter periplasmic adaptor subunit [Leucothrix sargassi]|nr:efflux RND transporter periplasmic adaptor subunit [Leucothrix sargassi]